VKAELLMRERLVLSRRTFVEIVIWRVPQAARSSTHPYKYRLAYIANQRCVLRFDNEAGLQSDFWAEVKNRRRGK
jgi:hypothetical protein